MNDFQLVRAEIEQQKAVDSIGIGRLDARDLRPLVHEADDRARDNPAA